VPVLPELPVDDDALPVDDAPVEDEALPVDDAPVVDDVEPPCDVDAPLDEPDEALLHAASARLRINTGNQRMDAPRAWATGRRALELSRQMCPA